MKNKKTSEIQFSKNDSFFLQKSIQVGFVTLTVLLIPFFSARTVKAKPIKEQGVSVSSYLLESKPENKTTQVMVKVDKKNCSNAIKQRDSQEVSNKNNKKISTVIGWIKGTPKSAINWVQKHPIVTIGWTATFLKAWKLWTEVSMLRQKVHNVEQNFQATKIDLIATDATAKSLYTEYHKLLTDMSSVSRSGSESE